MKSLKTLIFTLIILLAGAPSLWATEAATKPLNEVFDSVVIVPFDYHNKVFLNGYKTDLYGDYKLYQKDGRVLVPVRLMGNLMAELDGEYSYWQVNWEPQKPDDVTLVNYNLQKTVKLKVNSRTMYINNEPKTLFVPPQKLEGRIVLPLRDIAEALNKKIEWLDGLIIISDDNIDLQSPQTLGIKDRIKEKLADKRRNVTYEQVSTPVAKYKDTIYYIKDDYSNNKYTTGLYKKTGSQQEIKIELPGEERFGYHKLINNELYYVSTVNGKSQLNVFNFVDNKSRKLCDLGDWSPEDGWLGDIKIINNELYIVLHYGDITMGRENVYKVENGQLKEIADAKSFINFTVLGDYFYYTDFKFMFDTADNLYRVNMKTGEKENLGEKNFTYGIFRVIKDGGGTSYSSNTAFYIKDGYIYTLGYRENDETDKGGVYKISLNGQSQKKLTSPTKDFWLVGDEIYYIDFYTNHLVRVDLEGNNKKTLVDKCVKAVKFYNGNIFYTASKRSSTNSNLGQLYKYSIANGQEIKLSDNWVSEFFAGKAGVYYISEGYNLGLYKIDAGGKNICLVDDSVNNVLFTDEGLVYTLRYKEGVYTAK